MYYNGYSGGFGAPCCNAAPYGAVGYGAVGYGGGYGYGAALWIVLFILLVIIIGAGWSFGGHRDHDCC